MLIGVLCGQYVEPRWLAAALAVATSIAVMERLALTHPPGGATALLAAIDPNLRAAGWLAVFAPTLLGLAVLFSVALLVNNVARHYPLYWFRLPSAQLHQQPAKSTPSHWVKLVHFQRSSPQSQNTRHTPSVLRDIRFVSSSQ